MTDDENRRLAVLETTLTNFRQHWAQQDRRAEESRKRTYARLEELAKQVAGAMNQLAVAVERIRHIDERIEELAPSVRAQELREAALTGSRKTWAAIWAAAAMLGAGLIEFLSHLLWHKP